MEQNKVSQNFTITCLLVFTFIALVFAFGYFATFGYLSNPNGGCYYAGPLVDKDFCNNNSEEIIEIPTENSENESEELEEKELIEGFQMYENSAFSIQYPSNWFIKDQNILIIYSENPEKIGFEINENLNIVSQKYSKTIFTEEECQNFADSTLNQVKSNFENISLEKTGVITIGGLNACRSLFKFTSNGDSLIFEQNFILNSKPENSSFILTITRKEDSNSIDIFEKIINSFFIKL